MTIERAFKTTVNIPFWGEVTIGYNHVGTLLGKKGCPTKEQKEHGMPEGITPVIILDPFNGIYGTIYDWVNDGLIGKTVGNNWHVFD